MTLSHFGIPFNSHNKEDNSNHNSLSKEDNNNSHNNTTRRKEAVNRNNNNNSSNNRNLNSLSCLTLWPANLSIILPHLLHMVLVCLYSLDLAASHRLHSVDLSQEAP